VAAIKNIDEVHEVGPPALNTIEEWRRKRSAVAMKPRPKY
jgi:hypothetical protein